MSRLPGSGGISVLSRKLERTGVLSMLERECFDRAKKMVKEFGGVVYISFAAPEKRDSAITNIRLI
jgi:hypothetical protein